MKRLAYLFLLFGFVATVSSCEQVIGGDEELRLEVNANNISGKWELY